MYSPVEDIVGLTLKVGVSSPTDCAFGNPLASCADLQQPPSAGPLANAKAQSW